MTIDRDFRLFCRQCVAALIATRLLTTDRDFRFFCRQFVTALLHRARLTIFRGDKMAWICGFLIVEKKETKTRRLSTGCVAVELVRIPLHRHHRHHRHRRLPTMVR